MFVRTVLVCGLIGIMALAVVGCAGTDSDRPGSVGELPSRRDFVYDRMGYQVDPETGETLDTAYNRRREVQFGR